MMLHLGVMALCAACVSIVFATLQRDETAQQIKFGAQIFGALLGGVAGMAAFWPAPRAEPGAPVHLSMAPSLHRYAVPPSGITLGSGEIFEKLTAIK